MWPVFSVVYSFDDSKLITKFIYSARVPFLSQQFHEMDKIVGALNIAFRKSKKVARCAFFLHLQRWGNNSSEYWARV